MENGRRVYGKAKPPENSMRQESDPLTWTMTAVERRMVLVMKAHQPLDPPVDSRCCSRIDVALDITDVSPQTLSMEVLLVDSTAGRKGIRSLGELPVPRGSPHAILSFPSPPASGSFDAVEVLFHLAPERHNQSGNVAIRSFELVGR